MRDLNELRRLAKAASYADADNDVDLAFMAAANPVTFLALLDRLERAEADAASLRGLLAEAGKALEWTRPAVAALNGYERDYGDQLPDDHEIGRIDDSRDSPSFRIRVGHLRTARTVATKIEEALK